MSRVQQNAIGAYVLAMQRLGKETIGRGASGKVYKALSQETGQTVAIKQIAVAQDSKQLSGIHKEIGLMRRLDHPNIVRYFGSL